jgi:hypothetical protein
MQGKGKEGAVGQEAEGQGCAEGKEKVERGSGGKEEEAEAEMEEDDRLGEESRVEQGLILVRSAVCPLNVLRHVTMEIYAARVYVRELYRSDLDRKLLCVCSFSPPHYG